MGETKLQLQARHASVEQRAIGRSMGTGPGGGSPEGEQVDESPRADAIRADGWEPQPQTLLSHNAPGGPPVKRPILVTLAVVALLVLAGCANSASTGAPPTAASIPAAPSATPAVTSTPAPAPTDDARRPPLGSDASCLFVPAPAAHLPAAPDRVLRASSSVLSPGPRAPLRPLSISRLTHRVRLGAASVISRTDALRKLSHCRRRERARRARPQTASASARSRKQFSGVDRAAGSRSSSASRHRSSAARLCLTHMHDCPKHRAARSRIRAPARPRVRDRQLYRSADLRRP